MYVRARVSLANGQKVFSDLVLVDTGTTGIIADESIASDLGLRQFGEIKIATLGASIEARFADLKNVTVEDVDLGPRRIVVCRFPEQVKEKLRDMGFSEKVILGVSAVEDAGFFPNTAKGVLQKVGFLAI